MPSVTVHWEALLAPIYVWMAGAIRGFGGLPSGPSTGLKNSRQSSRRRHWPSRTYPGEALFLAGKAFLRYRRSSGTKLSVLPDFYIGAHAAVMQWTLLTRDARRYRTMLADRYRLRSLTFDSE